MTPSDSIAASLNSCNVTLGRLRRWLEGARNYEASKAAEDVAEVSDSITKVRREYNLEHRQRDRESENLEQKLRDEHVAKMEAQQRNRVLEEKLESRNRSIRELNNDIAKLKQELLDLRTAAQADGERKYHEGYVAGCLAGQQAERRRAAEAAAAAAQQPPQRPQRPTPPFQQPLTRTIDLATRDTWMTQLQLTSPSGPTLPSNLKRAILTGDKSTVLSILRAGNTPATSPALHLAALFGEIEIAHFLLQSGINVNGQCTARNESGHTLHGVTPMHLAVGAQHESMIRLLRRHGGLFTIPSDPAGHKTTVPVTWLVSRRWLRMTGRDGVREVVGVLSTMEELGWDVEAPVNGHGEGLRKVVERGLGGRGELGRAVVEFLEG